MSLLNLANKAQADGIGTLGVDLFISFEIDQTKEGVTLRQAGGLVDPELPGIRRLSFQALVRKLSYPAGLALAEALAASLTIRNTDLGTSHVYECYPRHEPYPVTKDDTGVQFFVLNFDAVWRSIA